MHTATYSDPAGNTATLTTNLRPPPSLLLNDVYGRVILTRATVDVDPVDDPDVEVPVKKAKAAKK